MSKKKTIQVGSFNLEKETATNKIKVTHESDHFGFRIWVPDLEQRFAAWTDKEYGKAYETIFSGIMLFVNFCLTNALYFSAWMKWHNEFTESVRAGLKEATDAEHEAALQEVKEDFEMGQEADANGVTFETARNNDLD